MRGFSVGTAFSEDQTPGDDVDPVAPRLLTGEAPDGSPRQSLCTNRSEGVHGCWRPDLLITRGVVSAALFGDACGHRRARPHAAVRPAPRRSGRRPGFAAPLTTAMARRIAFAAPTGRTPDPPTLPVHAAAGVRSAAGSCGRSRPCRTHAASGPDRAPTAASSGECGDGGDRVLRARVGTPDVRNWLVHRSGRSAEVGDVLDVPEAVVPEGL